MSKIKGQNVTINSNLVADETNCTVTVTGNTEDVTTKSDASLFSKDIMTSKSWQVQVDTYQAEASQLQAILTAFIGAAPVAVGWNVAGATDANGSGQALLNDFTMNFNDRETVAVSLQFQGTGALS